MKSCTKGVNEHVYPIGGDQHRALRSLQPPFLSSKPTAIGHGERERSIVSKVTVKLILKLSPPDRLATGTIAEGVSLKSWKRSRVKQQRSRGP